MTFDLGSVFGNLFGGIFGLASTAATNEVQQQIADKTNATNLQIARERNQLEIRESEKAYERSTASNQMRELLRLGISTQQARQIVLGSGNPAAYTPAQLDTAQAIPAQAVPYDMSGFGEAIGSAAGMIDNAISDPNGGALGYSAAHDAMQQLSDIITDIPEGSLVSWRDFKKHLLSSDNSKIVAFRDSPAFKKVTRSLFAQKAFMNYARNSYDMSGADALRRSAIFDAQTKEIDLHIAKFRERIEASNTDVVLLENDLKQRNLPTLYARDLLQCQDALALLRPQYKYHSTEAYQKQAFQILKQYNINLDMMQELESLKIEASRTGIENMSPTQQLLVDFFSGLHTLGIDNEYMLGAFAAEATAEVAADMFGSLTNSVPKAVEKVEHGVQVASQNVAEAIGVRKRGANRSF